MWDRIQRASQTSLSAIALVLAAILFVCVNLIAALAFNSARVDLTENQIYTVSPSTRAVLAAVEEPITLRFYLSSALVDEAPELRVYSDRVKELLRAYEQLSSGRIRVEVIDPVPFSAEEDKAISYNLVGFNLSRAGEQGYVGLVGTNSVDQLEVIEALAPSREAYFEYDLTRMVARLSSPTEPKVAVIDGLGLFGSEALGRQPQFLIQRLADDYELLQVPGTTTAIPDDADALVIVHPHNLSDSALYAIDQYVIRGKPALVFVDPLSENSPASPNNPAVPQFPDSYMERLLTQWGVTMPQKEVVGDIDMAVEIRGRAGNQVVITDYPPWLRIDRANLSPDDIVTGQLSLMRMSSAGALSPSEDAKTTFTPLIVTTPNNMLYDQAVVLRRANPTQLVNSFEPSGIVRTLAARVVGPVETAFPDGAPTPPESNDGPPPAEPPELVTQSDGPINVIIVADTDLLSDNLNLSANGGLTTQNGDFLINAVDSLIGGSELIGLRGRGLSYHPFTRVNEIEAAADARYRETEQRLLSELDDAESSLAQIRATATTPDGQIASLTREQQDTISEFNQRIVELRRELREVRSALRQEIDALSNQLRLINTLAMPAIVILIGILVAVWRRVRLSRYLRSQRVAA